MFFATIPSKILGLQSVFAGLQYVFAYNPNSNSYPQVFVLPNICLIL